MACIVRNVVGIFRSRWLPNLRNINQKYTANPHACTQRRGVRTSENIWSHSSTKQKPYLSWAVGKAKHYRANVGVIFFTTALISTLKTWGDYDTTVIPSASGGISFEEVSKHASEDDCWVVVKGQVYDLTGFLESHPGGAQAILSAAGTDASELFTNLHPSNALASLPPEAYIGPIDPSSLQVDSENITIRTEEEREELLNPVPDPADIFMLQDYENWAEQILSAKAWAYYRSAADQEKTFHENQHAFERYFLRPRILRSMQDGSINTEIMGIPTSMPVFMSPTAMAKLGHPLGEVNLTRAAGELGVIQAISSNSSCSLEEIFDAAAEEQPLVFQLYLNRDRNASRELIQKVQQLGAKAIIFTVDVSWASKRTMDVRHASTSAKRGPKSSPRSPFSIASAIGGYQDRDLKWEDISFIRESTSLPIIVKGVQSVEDIALCVENGVEGVILSNHGGRQADYAPAPIDILYEARSLRPELFDKLEIMIDGGIRCGADVVKALALGAKAVGIGRPLLYANGVHGQEGVKRVLEILREEITNTMRNIGVSRIEDLKPEMVGPAGPWVGYNRPLYMRPSQETNFMIKEPAKL